MLILEYILYILRTVYTSDINLKYIEAVIIYDES
jgi:hypothetical protein